MHVYVCVYVYGKYQNTKINREGILIYGYVCVLSEIQFLSKIAFRKLVCLTGLIH